MAWQLERAEQLAAQAQLPIEEAESIAIEMGEFLLQSPTDFLEALIGSPFGKVYRLFLSRCTNVFNGQQAQARREEWSQKLRLIGVTSNEGHGILLALMLLFPPGEMKVEDAASKLPNWLLEIYQDRNEPSSVNSVESNTTNEPTGEPSFTDRIFLNRILGLSNLYYIDPEDEEILTELRQVRLQTATLLTQVTSQELGKHFCGDFGERYWAMAQCGVQKESLDSSENKLREELQHWLSNTNNSLKTEGGIQRFAAVLLFNPPGSVTIADPASNLPAWFVEGFQRFCTSPTPA